MLEIIFVTTKKMAEDSDDASKTLLAHNTLSSSSSQQGGVESRMMVAPMMAPSTAIQPLCISYFNDSFMTSAEECFYSAPSRKRVILSTLPLVLLKNYSFL